MKKLLLLLVSATFAFISLPTLAQGGMPAPAHFFANRTRVVLTGALSLEPQTQIREAYVAGQKLTNGTGKKNMYPSYAVGFGLWFPLYNMTSTQINAVTGLSYVPGKSMRANGAASTHTYKVYVDYSRLNWFVGMNALQHIGQKVFAMFMLGGGLSMYHAKAEFFEDYNPVNSDHPGATTIFPYLTAQLGFGYQLTHKTQIMLFGNGNWTFGTHRVRAAEGIAGSNGYAELQPSNQWYLLGLKVTRTLNL